MPQPRRITHVALVGGATRMPAVQSFRFQAHRRPSAGAQGLLMCCLSEM